MRRPYGGATTRIARWSIRHPWWAMGLWLAFVAFAVVIGGMTGTREATHLGVGESGRAERIVASAGFADPATESVLITPLAAWEPAAAHAAADDAADRLRLLTEVAEVGEPVPSTVTDALLIPVTLDGDQDLAADRIDPVLAAVGGVAAAHPSLQVEIVGDASADRAIDDLLAGDLAKAGLFSVPVTLAVLLIAFGAIIAAGVPLLLALSAVTAAIGLWGVASQVFPDPGTAAHLMLLIGLAVGVDYSLFYLKREREERRRGAGHVDAVEIAAATSGRAVVVSGVAVLVSMAGLYLAGDVVFNGLATAAIIVVGVAVLGSLTVLPAMLAKLGRRVDRPRVPVLWRLTNRDGAPRLWPALLRPALRAPRTTLVVSLAVMAALAAPAVGMSLKMPGVEDLPRSIPTMRAYDRLVAAYPDEGDAHLVVVRAPAARAEAVRAALTGLVPAGGAEVRTSPDRTVSMVAVPVPYEIDAPRTRRSLVTLRTDLVPAAVGAVPGVEYAVGGDIADGIDYTTRQQQRLPWVIGFVVLLTTVIMAVAFRSIVVALVSGLLNVVSVAAAFGLLVLVFQNTWAESLLDFTSTGHVVTWIPLFLFVVLFGLSMDYHVFVVSRIREAVVAGADARDAVLQGITRSAGVVTSAAAVMVAVFSIFATLSIIEMKQLGVGLAAAIFIDATIVRILLLPSIMALLGRANWWPSRLGHRAGQRQPGLVSVT
ncbi:MMPL family transporter [Micromonospora sp. KC606]|uniref:MMPL family transporter n=1 Tax=Micromonospora sp. KC606 TaxID=2530379 RepID=UPI001047C700|nr:MMPL family transporter [Micromonospora sp. KC606]TDC77332.1 MMPL family transporter [Micromonospora sp. KC606]